MAARLSSRGSARLLSASGITFDRSVHRGASDAEEVAELGGAVLAGVM